MLKKWTMKLSIVLMVFMFFTSTTNVNAASNEVTVKLDGTNLWFDVPPKLIHNNVMVPMRVIFEALDATINWDNTSQTIIAVTENNNVLKLSIGNKVVSKNGEKVTIDSPPLLIEGYTFVPLRVIAESLDKSVNWDAKSRMVSITSPLPTVEEAYEKMIALEGKYPDGMRWTNDDYYAWKGGIFSGGYGCAAFAFILSDAVFGRLPSHIHKDFNNIRVGDIIRINYDTHAVIVLKIEGSIVTVAEGNFNSSIHWGNEFTLEDLKSVGDYIMTRYPK